MYRNIYQHMGVQIVKMTGEELKKVWDRSGLKQEDMQARLGISPASFYNYIKQAEIPDKVEARIDSDPELSKCKNMALAKPEEPPIRAGELAKFFTDTFQLIKEQGVMTSQAIAAATKAIDALSADNGTLRRLVDQGVESGALRWDKTG